jgi:type II secretory pathway component PulF
VRSSNTISKCLAAVVLALWLPVIPLVYIFPKMERSFADLDMELPWLTRSAIDLGTWLGGRAAGQFVPGVVYLVILTLLAAAFVVARILRAPAGSPVGSGTRGRLGIFGALGLFMLLVTAEVVVLALAVFLPTVKAATTMR